MSFNNKVFRLLFVYLLLLLQHFPPVQNSFSAQPDQQHHMGPPFLRVNSPEFNSDSTITFRIWAPNAGEIKLDSPELLNGQPDSLTKQDDGVWSITVKPAKAGLYEYLFLVDGVRTVDPKYIVTYQNANLLFVPGKEADFYTLKNVPHGAVQQHFYFSKSINTVRRVHIYMPPGYENNPEKNYPVLYLFHGSGGMDDSWIQTGRANVILDNLIALGLAQPMILVMPYGHTVEPGTSGWPFVQEKGDFISDFINDLVPFVEKNLRISKHAKNRALAGFSMGGYHTLKIGLNHTDLFGNLGVFSWGAGRDWFAEHVPSVIAGPDKQAPQFEQFRLVCGKDDFLIQGARDLDAALTGLNIKHTFIVSDGGHSMFNWRMYLYRFAQVLFRE